MAPGLWQIIIVILLIVVIFGASRVPLIAENMAKGIKSFKKGLKDEDSESQKDRISESGKDESEDKHDI